MTFVADASTVMCWVLEDESHPAASEAFARVRGEDVFVPTIWWFEVRNALLMNERRSRITALATADFLYLLATLPFTVDQRPDGSQLLALARRHRLTAYDAAYLELAYRMSVPLATLDGPLARAARAEGVVLLGDLA